jgi:tRNA modification GTPase
LEQLNQKFILLLERARQGRVLREGIHVVICGRPNSGKSSLLNALLKQERSIVTSIAGTTRDTIEEIIDIRGIPVRIVDTAGIIEPRDLVEKKAIERAKKQIKLADLVILLFDSSRKLAKDDLALIKKLKNKPVIAVLNKMDLKQKINRKQVAENFPQPIEISARKCKNISLLEEAIVSSVYQGKVIPGDPLLVGNSRHIQAVRQAQKLVAEALISLDNTLSWEFVAQDLKESLGFLDLILGKSFSEDLLEKIFNDFCIGK